MGSKREEAYLEANRVSVLTGTIVRISFLQSLYKLC